MRATTNTSRNPTPDPDTNPNASHQDATRIVTAHTSTLWLREPASSPGLSCAAVLHSSLAQQPGCKSQAGASHLLCGCPRRNVNSHGVDFSYVPFQDEAPELDDVGPATEDQPAASSPAKQSGKAKGKRGAPASSSPSPARRRKGASAVTDATPAAPAADDAPAAEQGDWTTVCRLSSHHADLTAGSWPFSWLCAQQKSLLYVSSE